MNASAVVAPNYIAIGAVTLVVAAAVCDVRARRIPNRLVLAGWLAALPAQCAAHGAAAGALTWLAGWLTGFAMLLPFYLLRGMAAGDVKLMAAAGAWLGTSLAFDAGLATFVLGGIGSVALAMYRGRTRDLLASACTVVCGQARRTSHAGGAGEVDASAAESNATAFVTAADTATVRSPIGTLPYGVAIALGTIGVLFAQT
jgi:prepilin peptidase CpaA